MPLFLHGRHVGEGFHTLVRKDQKWHKVARLVKTLGFGWIVHSSHDLLTSEVLGHCTAAVIRNVLDIKAKGAGHVSDHDRVFLTGASAPHDVLTVHFLDLRDKVFKSRYARVLVDPKHERIDAHHGDRCEGFNVDAQTFLTDRRCVERVERDHQSMVRVAGIFKVQ